MSLLNYSTLLETSMLLTTSCNCTRKDAKCTVLLSLLVCIQQTSPSESAFAYWAIGQYGKVTGDYNLQHWGNVLAAMELYSGNAYFRVKECTKRKGNSPSYGRVQGLKLPGVELISAYIYMYYTYLSSRCQRCCT